MQSELTQAHMNALPILIEHVRKSIGGADALQAWDLARRTQEQIDADSELARRAQIGMKYSG